jgi:tripartite-type tricarboxylate transporter receptor subunit TctC
VKRSLLAPYALALSAVLLARPSVAAESYPSRPVRIITPFPTGSGPDAVVRMVAEKLNRAWGKTVIVENRPGANGFIALVAVKNSAPDGYTLGQASNAQLSTHTLIYRNLPYDPVKDFAPITPLFRNSFFVVVGTNSPYKSVGDLIAAAKSKPGAVAYGSEFVGSPGHLGALLLGSATGAQMVHVPFKETTQLFSALASNEVAWAFSSAATATSALQAGRVKLLAVGMRARLPAYPDVPTVAENGGPADFALDAWTALLAPRGTPADIVARINKAVAAALGESDIRQRLSTFGYEAWPLQPADMAKVLEAETSRYAGIIRAANISFD